MCFSVEMLQWFSLNCGPHKSWMCVAHQHAVMDQRKEALLSAFEVISFKDLPCLRWTSDRLSPKPSLTSNPRICDYKTPHAFPHSAVSDHEKKNLISFLSTDRLRLIYVFVSVSAGTLICDPSALAKMDFWNHLFRYSHFICILECLLSIFSLLSLYAWQTSCITFDILISVFKVYLQKCLIFAVRLIEILDPTHFR